MNNLNKNQIKKKFRNYKYIKNFFKVYLEKHSEIGNSSQKLINTFNTEYGEINIDYDSISKEEKDKLIINYKKRNKLKPNLKIKIEDVINKFSIWSYK